MENINSSLVINEAQKIKSEVAKVISGQNEAIDQIIIAILCEGHILLEGVPGVAKTMIARSVAMAINTDFGRVQFTPDLMPSDITGTNVFNPAVNEFHMRKGPLFTGLLLADEINRTPPKTQAALLEAMQERRVTIDGETYPLSPFFTVIATQNPIEYEGTYPLPEAQLDRFMFKTIIGYPAIETEVNVLEKYNNGFNSLRLEDAGIVAAVDADMIINMRKAVNEVSVVEPLLDYIVRLVRKTRENRNLVLGGSPRASINLLQGCKAAAAMSGRYFATPDDIKAVAKPVLRHRLILRPEAEIEGLTPDVIIERTLAEVEVPREKV